jgi:hypothetical protein
LQHRQAAANAAKQAVEAVGNAAGKVAHRLNSLQMIE